MIVQNSDFLVDTILVTCPSSQIMNLDNIFPSKDYQSKIKSTIDKNKSGLPKGGGTLGAHHWHTSLISIFWYSTSSNPMKYQMFYPLKSLLQLSNKIYITIE